MCIECAVVGLSMGCVGLGGGDLCGFSLGLSWVWVKLYNQCYFFKNIRAGGKEWKRTEECVWGGRLE